MNPTNRACIECFRVRVATVAAMRSNGTLSHLSSQQGLLAGPEKGGKFCGKSWRLPKATNSVSTSAQRISTSSGYKVDVTDTTGSETDAFKMNSQMMQSGQTDGVPLFCGKKLQKIVSKHTEAKPMQLQYNSITWVARSLQSHSEVLRPVPPLYCLCRRNAFSSNK